MRVGPWTGSISSSAQGEFVAIVGPSGSGKSTLGALLAGIDKPTSGSLVIGGVRLDRMREDALAQWRSRHLGIVLQDFSLLPTLTAAENVELGLKLAGVRRERRRRAREALDRVGLGGLARRLPVQLSGGEQQRVAIARAIARRPQILVADEPTGSLDTANSEIVFGLIRDLAAGGTTVVFITHDPGLAAATPRVVTLVDGRIESDRVFPVSAVWRDLRRARGRTITCVIALALAIGTIGVFAVPSVARTSLRRLAARDHMAQLTVDSTPIPSPAALAAVPGVDEITTRTVGTERLDNRRCDDVKVVGMDFAARGGRPCDSRDRAPARRRRRSDREPRRRRRARRPAHVEVDGTALRVVGVG